MELLAQEQIEALDATQAAKHLKLIEKTYKLDKALHEWMTPELWDQLDLIINNLIWTEDHIAKIKQIDHLNSIRRTLPEEE